MREIKFRIYNEETKGFLRLDSSGIMLDELNELRPHLKVMQFTGLKDKNGKDIYEGDLITSFQNDDMPVEVFWDENALQWSTQNYHSTLSLRESTNIKSEIVGNVFQNPELLK